MQATQDIIKMVKNTSPILATVSTEKKNAALSAIADYLIKYQDDILAENEKDIENARSKLGEVMIDRLALSKERIEGMAAGIREIVDLPDPIGRIINTIERPNGIIVKKVSVPLGVISIIYESRPNVTSDATVLALKAGSGVVLRGGKEAFCSNSAIVRAIHAGLESVGLPPQLVGLVEDLSRDSATELMTATGLIDLLIPRGGAGLIRNCMENAKVPCIQTGSGICHIYVDRSADVDMAINIIENAKTSRPSVCNAAEVVLIQKDIASIILPKLKQRLVDERITKNLTPVELRLDDNARAIIDGKRAEAIDYDTEFLDYILAIRIVQDVNEAIEHIARHSTKHSEAIITKNNEAAETFVKAVDSAAVYINASTRFTDGGEFGLGCEMGISTQKLHARGPMGLEELTTYKYIVTGTGQIRV